MKSPENKSVALVGAGLVGSLLSIYLAKRGYKVTVYERRMDMRKHIHSALVYGYLIRAQNGYAQT